MECIADAGQFLGQLRQKFNTLSSDDHPASKRYHQWDGKNTKDLKDFLHNIDDEARRKMVQNVLDTFDQRLIQSGVADMFRKGVIHGDFNDANILLDSNFKVCGVIDFGDSVER